MAGFCAGIVVYLMYIVKDRAGIDKYSPRVYALLVPIIGTIVFTLLIAAQAVFTPIVVPKSIFPWICLIFTGIFFALTNLAIYTAFQRIELSIFTVIFRLNIVLVLIVGIIGFNESIDSLKLAGILIILIAVFIISFEKKDRKALKNLRESEKYSLSAGSLYALAAVVSVTFAVSLNKLALNSGMPPMVASWGNYFFQLPLLFSMSKCVKAVTIIKTCPRLIATWAVFVAFGWGGYIYALKIGNLSVVQPIFQGLQVVVPALFGLLVLKEKKELKEKGRFHTTLVSLFLTLIGILLISFSI